MKGLILLANYFEDMEAIITIDMLRRASITIDTVSITGDKEVFMQSGNKIVTEYLFEKVSLDEYEFLVIPGGRAVIETHLNNFDTQKAVKHFMNKQQLVACICAAPSILGHLGFLDNREFTCFPSSEIFMPKGIYKPHARVVISDNIITSKAAGTTFDFAYEIIKYLKDEQAALKVIKSIYY